MKIIYLVVFVFMCDNLISAEPYISPGLQIGINSNKEFYYGFQVSTGILINSRSNHIYSPSFCYGYKKFFNSNLNEKYIDFQIMSLPDTRSVVKGMLVPIGLGLGIDLTGNYAITRIKGYSWLFACITFDYNIKNKFFNTSLIPVLPIASMM